MHESLRNLQQQIEQIEAEQELFSRKKKLTRGDQGLYIWDFYEDYLRSFIKLTIFLTSFDLLPSSDCTEIQKIV